MMCALCGLREAAVFLRGSRSGSSVKELLCEDCARSRGIVAGQGRLELRIEELLDAGAAEPSPTLACPSCGLEAAVFRRERRLGCAACAEAFRGELPRGIGPAEGPPPGPQAEREADAGPRLEPLAAALAREDYEEAARLRDLLALPLEAPLGAASPEAPRDQAPEGDVVLWTRARLERNFSELPFPGSPRAPAQAGLERGLGLLAGLLGLEGLSLRELGAEEARAAVELGLLSPPFSRAAGARAFEVLRPSPESGSGGLGARLPGAFLAVFDEANHLSLRLELPGLAAAEAEEGLAVRAARLETGFSPAYDPELGYLASSLEDCGRGLRLSLLLHLPALERSGLLERAFKAVMARGFAIRGRYGRSESGAGGLYELSAEAFSGAGGAAPLLEAARLLVSGERRARAELLAEAREELLDAVGRALGIASYARRLTEAEALDLLSALRLGALAGLLSGLDPDELAGLMGRLGPAGLAASARARGLEAPEAAGPGARSLPGRASAGAQRESLRAALLRRLASQAAIEGAA